MNAKVDPSYKRHKVIIWLASDWLSHLCIGCDRLNDGLRGARDVGEMELGAAALLHAAAHNQLVVAPVHCQHLQDVEHEVEEDNSEDKAVNEEKYCCTLLKLSVRTSELLEWVSLEQPLAPHW